MKPYVVEYLEKMQAEPIQVVEDASTYHPSEVCIPLIDRIKRLLASLPESERNMPKTMEFFQTRLRGRKGKTAHVGEIADALRKLGYIRKRSWTGRENGFCAFWHPTE